MFFIDGTYVVALAHATKTMGEAMFYPPLVVMLLMSSLGPHEGGWTRGEKFEEQMECCFDSYIYAPYLQQPPQGFRVAPLVFCTMGIDGR